MVMCQTLKTILTGHVQAKSSVYPSLYFACQLVLYGPHTHDLTSCLRNFVPDLEIGKIGVLRITNKQT